jgi:hypothetical protein
MKTKNQILTFIIALITFTSCEKIVDVDLPVGETALVVESMITNQKEPWVVKLSLSQPYLDQNDLRYVSNAKVNIKGTDGQNVDLVYTENGIYRSSDSLEGKVGETYTLNVEYNNKVYTGSERMPNGYPLDVVQSFFLPNANGFIRSGYYLFIKGKQVEIKGEANYFWKFFKNDTLQESFLLVENDDFGDISFLNQEIDQDNPLAGILDNIIPRPFPFILEVGDSIKLEQYVLSRPFYQYKVDLDLQLNRSGTPFDPPPANPRNNLSNGALGYFSVANKITETHVVTE